MDDDQGPETVSAKRLVIIRQASFSTIKKRRVFCVRDRLRMNKHKAWKNNSVVVPKPVGSMTTKGQMKQTFRPKRTAKAMSPNIVF